MSETKIKGYRNLSEVEKSRINLLKEHGEKTRELIESIEELRLSQLTKLQVEEKETIDDLTESQLETSLDNLAVAKIRLQEGQMWLIRAIGLPDTF